MVGHVLEARVLIVEMEMHQGIVWFMVGHMLLRVVLFVREKNQKDILAYLNDQPHIIPSPTSLSPARTPLWHGCVLRDDGRSADGVGDG